MSVLAAFFLHIAAHTLLLLYLAPMISCLGTDKAKRHGMTFKRMSQLNACSWFTANPVNCIRSRLIYKHSPPCHMWQLGKEEHLRVNEAIGCYFDDDAAKIE